MLTTTNTTDEHKRSMRESDDEFDKSAKNDFINQERGVDNSIGKEGTTNNKFDEVSTKNDKIVEKRASWASKIVDEDAVEKDESVRSAMSRRLYRMRIRSSRRVNQVNAQKQRQSRFWVSGVQEFEFHRVKRWRPGRDQISEVSSSNTRTDLRVRHQRCVIEDANEDCQSASDAIHWQGEGHQIINSKEHWMVLVIASAWDECQQFKLYRVRSSSQMQFER